MVRLRTSARAALAGACLLVAAMPAAAQVNFSGEWSGRYHEDQPDRVPGEEPGDFSGIPLNDAARMFGDSYDVGRHSVLEEQCAPYTLPYMFFGPNQFRIWQEVQPDTQELVAIQMYMGTYQQRRTIWMDGRPHPPDYAPHTFMGFSTGEWNGDTLTITTTHIKQGYFRRSGVPASDRTVVVEHWMRHGTLLSQVTIATDPVYLTEPVHPQPGIRADGARQHQLALQLRIRDGGAARQERRAALPARQEPVGGRVRGQARDAARGRARRRRDAAAGVEAGRRGRASEPGEERRLRRRQCSRSRCRPATCAR